MRVHATRRRVERRRRPRHRARRPLPAGPDRRRPGAVPGAQAACSSSSAEPRLDRDVRRREHCDGLRRAARAPAPRSTRTTCCAATGLDARRRSSELRRRVARSRDADRHLLGDGPHAAPQRGRHDPGDRQLRCSCAATSASRARALCPVRGHSNVQGDRTMGICEQPTRRVPRRARQRRSASSRRASTGFDTVDAIRAMQRRRESTCSSRSAATSCRPRPTPTRPRARSSACRLTVQRLDQAQPLAPRRPATQALILPASGAPSSTLQAGGEQFVTVEDSMSVVHASHGRLEPAVAGSCAARSRSSRALAERVLGDRRADRLGASSTADYDPIRDQIAQVVPGFERLQRARPQPDGFPLPQPAARRARFATADGTRAVHRQPARRARRCRRAGCCC